MKIMNNVFHADRLRKDPHNPLPGQEQRPEDPVEVNGFPEWEVDKILASRSTVASFNTWPTG